MKTLAKFLLFTVLTVLTVFGCKRKDNPQDPYLNISCSQMDTDGQILVESGIAEITIGVESNRDWAVRVSDLSNLPSKYYEASPAMGSNNGTVTVLLDRNAGETRQLRVTIEVSGIIKRCTIVQEGSGETVTVYSETFGTVNENTEIADHTDWVTAGEGAQSVTYSAEGGRVQLRTSAASSGYPGASGKANVMMGSTGESSLLIHNIQSCEAKDFDLWFGTNKTHDTISVWWSTDGNNWIPIGFTKTVNGWELIQTSFSIPEGTTSFKLKFTSAANEGGARIDDIKLRTSTTSVSNDYLILSRSSLAVSSDTGTYAVNITSNLSWTVQQDAAAAWCEVTPTGGSANGTLNIRITQPNSSPESTRSATVKVQSSDGTITRQLTITQDVADPENLILADDFGPTSSGNPTIETYTGWNRKGLSKNTVSYSSEGGKVDVRITSGSRDYADASGGNNVMMASNGASFIINSINPHGAKYLALSFGVNVSSSVMSLAFSADGGAYFPIPFSKTADEWGLIEVEFEIPENTTDLKLKFTAGFYQYGSRVDDINLTKIESMTSGTTLFLSPETWTNVNSAGDNTTVSVMSNSEWVVKPDANATWCTVTESSGNGNGTLHLNAAANTTTEERTATITVETSGTDKVTKTITVTQLGAEIGTVIFADDFGTGASGNPYIETYTDWNRSGNGIEDVEYTYEGHHASVRTSAASSGYIGASGGNNIMTASTADGSILIKNITPGNSTNFTLKFGMNVQSAVTATVSYSIDGGTTWTELPFTKSSGWNLTSLSFNIPAPASSISFKFSFTSNQSGSRIDDVKLLGLN